MTLRWKIASAVAVAVLALSVPLLASGYLSTAPIGQRSWYWQNPVPQGNDLQSMSFPSDSVGWAVGRSGTIIKTVDGGSIWDAEDAGTTSDLAGVSFIDGSTGWVVGAGGTIRHTVDGGASWDTQVLPGFATTDLKTVSFLDSTHGIAAGGSSIYHTTDGGLTWRAAATPLSGTTTGLTSVTWSSAVSAYAVGDAGTILKSTDGGATWARQTSGVSSGLSAVAFVRGSTVGYAVGSAQNATKWTLLKTANGGATWTGVGPAQKAVSLYGVDCSDASNVTVVGAGGAVLRTSDGGTTWKSQPQSLSTSVVLHSVDMVTSNAVRAVGDFGAVVTTSDGGVSWNAQTSSNSTNLLGVWLADARNGWVVGSSGTIMRTTDGGASWAGQSVGSGAIRGVCFPVDSADGWIVGDAGAIKRSSDGGATWKTQVSGTSEQLNAVWFVSKTDGWAVGTGGTILRTANGGSTWTSQTSATSAALNGVWFADATTGWVVGARGTLLKTTNGGATWVAQSAPTNKNLNDIRGVSATSVWAVGDGGALLRTTNGANWASLASGTPQNLYAVFFASASDGWVSGAYGTVLGTTSGGTSWTAENVALPAAGTNIAVRGIAFSGTSGVCAGDAGTIRTSADGGSGWDSAQAGTVQALRAIAFSDPAAGWAAGDAGVVLHTANGGETWFAEKSGTTANLFGVSMPTSSTGWVVGAAGTIRKTADGGQSWSSQTSGTTLQLQCVSAADASHAIAAGAAGTIRYTSNGGSTWSAPGTPPTTQSVNAAYMTGPLTGFIGTNYSTSGVIFKTTDGGATWRAQSVAVTGHDIAALDFFGGFGWAVTSNGAVLKSSDGGSSWSVAASGADWSYQELNGVHFYSALKGYAVGEGGLVLYTADGGTTWSRQHSGTTYHSLSGIEFVDANNGWIVGSGGLIMRTTDQTAPNTLLVVTPTAPNGRGGWYITRPSIAFNPQEAATTWFDWSVSAGDFFPVQGSVEATEGTSQLSYYSVDPGGNRETTQTATFKVDTTAPTAPRSVTAEGLSPSEVIVRWADSSDGGSGVERYDVSAEASVVASTTETFAVVGGLRPNTTSTFRVMAVDAAGNVSAASSPATGTTQALDTSPMRTVAVLDPAMPDGANGWYITRPTVGLSAEPETVAANVNYSWTIPSNWERYSMPLRPAVDGTSQLYFYSIDSSLTREPEVPQSLQLMVDTVVPAAPSQLTTVPFSLGQESVKLAWPAVTGSASGIDHYEVFEDGTYLAATSDAEFEVLGLTAATAYRFAVRAVNGAGVASALGPEVTVTTLTPPLPPAPPSVFAKAVSGESVYVNWEPAEDTHGAVSYNVWRSLNAVYYEQAGVVRGKYNCSFVDTAVHPSLRYYYAISVVDDRGEGPRSIDPTEGADYAAATTRGPMRPTGLAAVEGSSSVGISWQPDTDAADVVGYIVTRSGRSQGAVTTMTPVPVTSPFFVDATAQNGDSYYYRVRAVDGFGTVGLPSTEVRAVARRGLPDAPSPHVTNGSSAFRTCEQCHGLHGSVFSAEARSFDSTAAVASKPATAAADAKMTRAQRNQSLCLSCHDGTKGSDIKSQVSTGSSESRHPDALAGTSGSMSCMSCHSAHRDPSLQASSDMLDVKDSSSGNGVCYKCHGDSGGSVFSDMDDFEDSGHSILDASAQKAGIACLSCHEAHGSDNPQLTKYSGVMVCVQCHSSGQSDPNKRDIWEDLTLNADSDSRHPLLPSDQSNGGRITCQNCHNTHTASARYPLVDPRDPSPSGKWTRPGSDANDFCLRCHGPAGLPTSAETSPWVEPPLASGGTTSVADIETAWSSSVHGHATSDASHDRHLRPDMGFQVGDKLQCDDCHDMHGTANSFALKQDVESADGSKAVEGVAVVKIAEGAYDFRYFCNTCHVLDPSTHTAAPIDQFPTDCMAAGCHRHVSTLGESVSF